MRKVWPPYVSKPLQLKVLEVSFTKAMKKDIFFFLKDRFGNRWSRFALMVVIFLRPEFWHLFLGCPMGGLAESDFGGGVCDARSH